MVCHQLLEYCWRNLNVVFYFTDGFVAVICHDMTIIEKGVPLEVARLFVFMGRKRAFVYRIQVWICG